MKNISVYSLVSSMVILLCIYSCNTDQNPSVPDPSQKQKYVWACGQPDSTGYGMILFSSNAGETWIRQGTGSPALNGIILYDIWAIDENNVWAVGSNNSAVRTTDNGKTWERFNLPGDKSDQVLQSIHIVNKTKIYIIGDNGTVYNSTDNGNSWEVHGKPFFEGNALQGVWAISPEKVYVVGGNIASERGFIAFTTNGGITWDTISPANDYNMHRWIGVTAHENTIIIYGARSHYLVSIDGGLSWKNDSLAGTGGGGGGADINHLIIIDSKTWWGAFDMGQIFITTDGGVKWSQQPTSGIGQYFMMGIDAWDSKLAIAVGAQAQQYSTCPIIKTDNGGLTWVQKYTTANSSLFKVTFIKN